MNNINDQIDATITILLIFKSAQHVSGKLLPIFRSLRLWLQQYGVLSNVVVVCPKHVELIQRSIKLLLLHLVGHFYYSPILMMHGQTQIKFTTSVFRIGDGELRFY